MSREQAAVQEARVQSEKYILAIHTNNYEAAKSALSALAKLLEDRAHNRAVSAEIGRSAPQAAITLNVSREELRNIRSAPMPDPPMRPRGRR